MAFDMKDYREVPERIAEWYERHPEGRIVCEVLDRPGPWAFGSAGDPPCDRWTVKASVYRTADPNEPPAGVGHSFLQVPGKTPYTKDSELENAETSAAGRALVMAGIPAKQVSSEQEVRSKSGAVEPAGGATTSGGMAATDEGAASEHRPVGAAPSDARALSSQVRTLLRFAEELRWSETERTHALAEAFPGVTSLGDLTQEQARELIPLWQTAARSVRMTDEQVAVVKTLASFRDAKAVAERLFGFKVPNLHVLTNEEGDRLIEALREVRGAA